MAAKSQSAPSAHSERLYSLHDLKARSYGVPFHAPSDVVASRSVAASASKPGSVAFMYPDDFELVFIGDFFVDSGAVLSCKPVRIASVRELLASLKSQEVGNG